MIYYIYFWVYIIFDYLTSEDFKKILKEIEFTITTLPKNINQVYKQILNKSKENKIVRKTLSIILVVNQLLTLSEMNVAVNISDIL